MQPITGPSVAAVVQQLESQGWQRNGSISKRPPLTFHHEIHSKQAVIVQKMTSGKGRASFYTNW